MKYANKPESAKSGSNFFANAKPTIVLGAICLISALLLALVNMITGPVIEAAQHAAANAALAEVLPDGKNFEEITLDQKYDSVKAVGLTKGYKADGGYVFQATVTGKSSGLIIMCGIDSEGKVVTSGRQVFLGGNDRYIAMCHRCWINKIKEQNNGN